MVRLRIGAIAGVALLIGATLLLRGALAASPAEMRVNAPEGTQPVGSTFEVTVSITRAGATWAGYTDQMTYDSSVLEIKDVTRGGIASCDEGTWANPQKLPTLLAACVFQSTTATGTTEKIQMQCLKDGTSLLHLITTTEDTINGSTLFDVDAVTIPTDLVDAKVTCGGGGPVATVPIPTNPSQSDLLTAAASPPWTPIPTGPAGTAIVEGQTATAASVSTARAQGTVVPQGTAPPATSGTAVGSGTAGSNGTPRASGTAQQGLVGSTKDNSGGGSSKTGWIIGGIAAALVVIVGAGGAFFYRGRSRAQGI
jgi:hypothetical protein